MPQKVVFVVIQYAVCKLKISPYAVCKVKIKGRNYAVHTENEAVSSTQGGSWFHPHHMIFSVV